LACEGPLKKVHYEVPIYTFHIDYMRHVSNIVYIEWMEVGRTFLLEAVGMSVERIAEQGFGPVLVETHIAYKKPLVIGDAVKAEVWLSELAQASAWLEHRFYNGAGELAATGRQRGIFVDLKTGKPRRLSAEDRPKLEQYLIPTEQP
jgi:acyl-CoA thioester hydrolase